MESIERVSNGDALNKDTLYMLGGVALVVFGAGLILSNPIVRRYMGQLCIADLAGNVMPDIERYMKISSM